MPLGLGMVKLKNLHRRSTKIITWGLADAVDLGVSSTQSKTTTKKTFIVCLVLIGMWAVSMRDPDCHLLCRDKSHRLQRSASQFIVATAMTNPVILLSLAFFGAGSLFLHFAIKSLSYSNVTASASPQRIGGFQSGLSFYGTLFCLFIHVRRTSRAFQTFFLDSLAMHLCD